MEKPQKIIVVGAGLVGSLLALLLGRRGHEVLVLERRPDMRREKISAGRSINLALSDRGWRALAMAGIEDEVRKLALPMRGRRMHAVDGARSFLPYSEDGQCIYSVSRGGLNIEMMNAAEDHEHVNIVFDCQVSRVDFKKREVRTKDGRTFSGDVILGTDGAFSAVRLAMQLSPLRLDYRQDYLTHGYKELTIPPADDGGFRIENDGLHIWPRGPYMLIALPNLDGSFTVTLFLAFTGEPGFDDLKTPSDVQTFFDRVFPDVVPHMPTLVEDFFANPLGELVTVRCTPWHVDDKACLLGDAAHAIVPFYGQGMNAGFEDCRVFCDILDEVGPDWAKVLSRFSTERKPNADAIADLALYNFIEMRDRVADPKFLLQKKIEARISKRYGKNYLPLYSMVTFSHVDYAEAQRVGAAHEVMMQGLLQFDNVESTWDSEAFDEIVDSALAERGIRKPT